MWNWIREFLFGPSVSRIELYREREELRMVLKSPEQKITLQFTHEDAERIARWFEAAYPHHWTPPTKPIKGKPNVVTKQSPGMGKVISLPRTKK